MWLKTELKFSASLHAESHGTHITNIHIFSITRDAVKTELKFSASLHADGSMGPLVFKGGYHA